jgi:hypothetical protein
MLQSRPLQLDFPHFNDENPAGWTYKVNQLATIQEWVVDACFPK